MMILAIALFFTVCIHDKNSKTSKIRSVCGESDCHDLKIITNDTFQSISVISDWYLIKHKHNSASIKKNVYRKYVHKLDLRFADLDGKGG